MERDFLGLSLKESLVVVKEEINNDGGGDSGNLKVPSGSWWSSNKVSGVPHLMSLKVGQEDHTKKTVCDPLIAPRFLSALTEVSFDPTQKRTAAEFQKSINHVKMYSVSNQPISVSVGNPFLKNHFAIAGQMASATGKQSLLGGVPVTAPHSIFPPTNSVAGITEPWNSVKSSGSSAQLTIFYAGTVNVYNDILPEKAEAIMLLAGNGSYVPSNASHLKAQVHGPCSKMAAGDGVPATQPVNAPPCSALSSPVSVSSHIMGAQSGCGSTNTDDLATAKTTGVPNTPVCKAEPPRMVNATAMMPSAVPQARKASLARFLEKRKERVMSAAPYNLSKKSPEGGNDNPEPNGANFS